MPDDQAKVSAAMFCPLCGAANNCGAALGQASACWCMAAPTMTPALAQLAPTQNYCICQDCAQHLTEETQHG